MSFGVPTPGVLGCLCMGNVMSKPHEEDPPGRGVKRKGAQTVEPVFWHARPAKFFDCLRKTHKVKGWIDFGGADGQLALQCAKNRIPYVGVCLTEEHRKLVRERGIQQLMESSFMEGSGDRMRARTICCHTIMFDCSLAVLPSL